jgi:hypothetical protein
VDPDVTRSAKVSVVCAWFNRAGYLRDTLDSLLAQEFGDFDITLVDDGSTDPRVGEILGGYADPRLRVIRQANAGFVAAIRRAIDESRGPYIAVMGAGDVALPARLARQAAVLDADPDCVLVGCSFRSVTVDRDGTILASEECRRPDRRIGYEDVLRRVGSPFTHGEVMYRRAAYAATGGYRPVFRYAQDMDLWLRLARIGHFTFCPEVLYERREFLADGIQADMRKKLVQLGQAHLAQECARERDRSGQDVVDLFGLGAGLVLAPDAFMSRLLATTALKYLRAGRVEEARFLARLSGRGGRLTARSAVARLLVAMHGWRPLRAAGARIVRALPIRDTREARPMPAPGPQG